MSGEHIAALRQAVAGIRLSDLRTSRMAWDEGVEALGRVKRRLDTAAPEIRTAFGHDSDTGVDAEAALVRIKDKVTTRQAEMVLARDELDALIEVMAQAKRVAGEMPTESPGPAPRLPADVGATEEEQIQALKVHAAQVRTHDNRVSAYAASDARAEVMVERLNEAYSNAADTFAEIHGEPDEEAPRRGGLPPAAPLPLSGRAPAAPPPGDGPDFGLEPVRPPHAVVEWEPRGDEPRPPDLDPSVDPAVDPPVGPEPSHEPPTSTPPAPVGPHQPVTGANGGSALSPGVLGGAAAAGVFGAPGLLKGLRGALGLSSGPSRSAAAIGTSTRAGGPGALGRPAAGTPGAPVARGAAGGRTSGGARGGPGAGVPGSQAGRGSTGSRGAAGARVGAAGVGGGRSAGRRDEERQRPDEELYDDGRDWLDDEGAAPGVLG